MAVFTEAELKSANNADVFTMLEGANYLTEEESRIQPQLIPVKENSRLKGYVVRFEDIENLVESVNCDYITAMQSVSETNNLDKPLIVAVDECDLIEDPSLLQELNNVVISPINENDIVYQYCENILNEYMETEDESLLEAITKDQLENEKEKNNKPYMQQQQNFYQKPNELQNMMHKDSEKINKIYNNPESSDNKQTFNAPAVLDQFDNQQSNNIVSKYATRPKSIIVRKIAALRNLYHKWMIKAKTSKDTGFVAKIKRMCAKVLGVIDKLLKIVNNKLKGKAQKAN